MPQIPVIQALLGLSETLLGTVLLPAGAGALGAMQLSGLAVGRYGSRIITIAAGVVLCFALPVSALAPALPVLIPAVVLFGAANGALDVAMNAHGILVESRMNRSIMSSLHALFSLGGLCGAAAAALLFRTGTLGTQIVIGPAVALGLLLVTAAPRLLPSSEDAGHTISIFSLPDKTVMLLGLGTFLVLVTEGAMMDWSTVYLRTVRQVPSELAAAGYATFSLTMAAGRFTGDTLAENLGDAILFRMGARLAALGLPVSFAGVAVLITSASILAGTKRFS